MCVCVCLCAYVFDMTVHTHACVYLHIILCVQMYIRTYESVHVNVL